MRARIAPVTILAWTVALALAGCAAEQGTERVAPVPPPAERGSAGQEIADPGECRRLLQDDATPDTLLQAAERNLEYLSRLPLERRVTVGGRELSVRELVRVTQLVKEHAQQPLALCEAVALRAPAAGDSLVVAGYYQPELRASRKRNERFRYPVYRPPDDLVDVDLREWCPTCPPRVLQGRVKDGKLVPYFTRSEIEAGALGGRGYELAWLEDPVEAYFLHVQGSALLELEDGVRLQISYASSNGHPYVSLGKVLSEQGKLPPGAVSLRDLKDYLRAHPEEQRDLFALNPQYVFFRGVVAGPMGSCQVPLTAGRSLAADPAVYPHGTVAFLEMQPDAEAGGRGKAYRRLVFLQDSGTTVSGSGRVDLYCGSGELAEAQASNLRHRGRLWFLVPR